MAILARSEARPRRGAAGEGHGALRRLGLVLPALIAFCLCAGARPAAPSAPNEYALKAAFLYNFAKFVTWPDSSLGHAAEPFVIAVLGDDPFGPVLEATVAEKHVGGHPIAIERASDLSDLGRCQLLYISDSEKRLIRWITSELEGRPILTVASTEGFARDGGMIGLLLDGEQIRFDVSPMNIEQVGLRISSKLLSLARDVIGCKKGPHS